ncbi:FecR family protein [Dyadobacter subterraneus]|uniref:FecR domain-containing protein n=1 Tax=Dyadobacter subterraneus TaxID=2773304 RepID=A0ABR9W7K7_9BACT|nr:FecR family protein [Dyadobacter subterraneus]MBE9461440.1 FecR domain-containing protein [Dyadobacter subterraneus]
MHWNRINFLTEKFFRNACSEAEKQELALWIKENPDDQLSLILENAWDNFDTEIKMPEHSSDRILNTIFPEKEATIAYEYSQEADISSRQLWAKIAVAAALIMAIGIYWWSGIREKNKMAMKNIPSTLVADLPPGGNKAILTLGDGSNIILDSAGNGNLASQGNTNITKSGTGQLIYKSNNTAAEAVVFNTVTTPKGGQYHIVLPDGSKVWLNAASSLRFPTAFIGKERRVEITGEVYFEVAHNTKMPFIVKTGETEVAVLGTHFNVMAYADEKVMKTTLMEGSVKISRSGKSAMLAPGQQARLTSSSENIRVLDHVDTDKEMAWKTGYFQFEDDNLESIMRQVSRWYDVDIAYEGNASREHFTGRLPRNANVSKVLKILSLSGVKFRIEGKSIIVTP